MSVFAWMMAGAIVEWVDKVLPLIKRPHRRF
jgi:hypothetical protein